MEMEMEQETLQEALRRGERTDYHLAAQTVQRKLGYL